MTASLTESELALERGARLTRTAAYYLAFIILGMGAAIVGPTVDSLAAQVSVSIATISSLFAARSVTYLLGSLLSGKLFDRVPTHRLMAGVLLLMAVMLFVTPLTPWFGVLILVFAALGWAEATLDLGGNLSLLWVHGHDAGPYLNGLHFFFGLGAFLAPLFVAWSLRQFEGITWAYWLMALLAAPPAIWLLRQSSPRLSNVEASASAGGVSQAGFVALIALFYFLYVGAEVSFGGWIYLFAVKQPGLSQVGQMAELAAYLTSAFWGAFTFGRLLSIPLAARWRARTLLLVDMFGALGSVGLILLFPNSWVAIWVGAIGLGLSLASIFPTVMAFAERRMVINGAVARWFFVGAGLGGTVLPWLIGRMIEPRGPMVIMFAIFIDLCLVLAVFLLMMARAPQSLRGAD
ncbi:MAG TPA: MFS transporter [Anaerolineales bacterium]|nr:MFS transporter [Anaerolineales bacterium]